MSHTPNPIPLPLCTHIKTNGVRCGSPALKGTALCFHHTAVTTALGKVTPLTQVGYGSFSPIPFVFPEDRAAMQINYFLLLQALNEQRVEKRAADLMLRMLRSMDKNLGKSGSLLDAASEAVSDGAVGGDAVSNGAGRRADGASESASQQVSENAAGEAAGERERHEEMLAYVNQRISAVNAAAASGYKDYREVSALHPAGQRVLNMYCQPPKDK